MKDLLLPVGENSLLFNDPRWSQAELSWKKALVNHRKDEFWEL